MRDSLIKLAAFALLAVVPTAALAERPSTTVNAGRLEYRSSAGVVTILTTGEDLQSPALAPNGRSVAYIRALKPEDSDRDGIAELWIADGPTGRSHRLLKPHIASDPKANLQWFDRPLFSADGKFIYVSALAWGDENAVHAVDVRTGKERFIVDGTVDAVIRSGPYRGNLLVARHTAWPPPKAGFHYPLYVVRPGGSIRMRVPNTDDNDSHVQAEKWLALHGWAAW